MAQYYSVSIQRILHNITRLFRGTRSVCWFVWFSLLFFFFFPTLSFNREIWTKGRLQWQKPGMGYREKKVLLIHSDSNRIMYGCQIEMLLCSFPPLTDQYLASSKCSYCLASLPCILTSALDLYYMHMKQAKGYVLSTLSTALDRV